MKKFFCDAATYHVTGCKISETHSLAFKPLYPTCYNLCMQVLSIAGLFMFLLIGNISLAQPTGGVVPTGMSKMNIHLLLNNNGGSSNAADACMILYKSNFTPGIGPEDSYKFYNIDENMAIPCGNALLSVMGKPFAIDYDTIPLKIWQYRHANYILNFDGSNFSPTQVAVLKDNYLQQEFPISLTGITNISFSLSSDTASSGPNRFCVYLRPAGTLALYMTELRASLKTNGVQVEWKIANEATVDHYEVERSSDATEFVNKTFVPVSGGGLHLWIDKEAPSGTNYYRIKTVEKSGNVELSKIVKVVADTRQRGITIYPNPVTGNKIGFQLQDMEKGVYQLKLYNSNGQAVFNTLLSHPGGTGTHSIPVDSHVSKGTYTILMTNGINSYNRIVLIN